MGNRLWVIASHTVHAPFHLPLPQLSDFEGVCERLRVLGMRGKTGKRVSASGGDFLGRSVA